MKPSAKTLVYPSDKSNITSKHYPPAQPNGKLKANRPEGHILTVDISTNGTMASDTPSD